MYPHPTIAYENEKKIFYMQVGVVLNKSEHVVYMTLKEFLPKQCQLPQGSKFRGGGVLSSSTCGNVYLMRDRERLFVFHAYCLYCIDDIGSFNSK